MTTTILTSVPATQLFWICGSIAVMLLCILCAGFLIPQILLISFRKKLFDESDERKIHKGAVPRLGGIAFTPVILFSMALLYGTGLLLGYGNLLGSLSGEGRALAFGFCCILTLFIIGMADDLIGIRYTAKFTVQVLCALMLLAGGVWINDMHGLLGFHSLPAWLGYPFTVLVVVFIINAVNLIDGLDGLASGLCGVAALFYGVMFLIFEEYICAVLSFATFGVLVPFYYYNVFGDVKKQKKIFMGDTGSLTLGMILSILSIKLMQCGNFEGKTFTTPNIFILAYSPLFVPCFDVVRVYLHRVRNHQNPFLPDKNHIHHKLLALGMGQRTAMMTIVLGSCAFTLINIVLSLCVEVTLLVVADIVAYTVLNMWLTRKIFEKQNN